MCKIKMDKNLKLYINSCTISKKLMSELDNIFQNKINEYEYKKLIEIKKKFQISEHNIISNLHKISTNSEKLNSNDILNVNQIKINILALKNIIESKEDLYKNSYEIEQDNIKLKNKSEDIYNCTIKHIIESKYNNQSLNKELIIENKNKIYDISKEYRYTLIKKYRLMKNKNINFISEIEKIVNEKIINTNKILEEIKSSQQITYHNSNSRNHKENKRLNLFIEEEKPKFEKYISELKYTLSDY